jgi:hypothetical protein
VTGELHGFGAARHNTRVEGALVGKAHDAALSATV